MLSRSDRESISKLSPALTFSILVAISLAIWGIPLASSFALALRDDQYTHIWLILPISITLVFLDWKPPESSTAWSSALGIVLLVLATGATVVARLGVIPLQLDEQLSLNMLSLVLFWIGAFIVGFGVSASKHAVFPLLFLLWMVPFPGFVLNPIVRLLQEGSVAAAHFLFAVAGVPVAENGMQMAIPGLTIEVARECSSIRSSMMLLVTTMFLAQVLLRSVWRKALVIAVAIPLSVAKNGLRIFVLAMLATHLDPSFLTGRLHHQGGVIYFLIAEAAIFLLIWIARHGDEKRRILAITDR